MRSFDSGSVFNLPKYKPEEPERETAEEDTSSPALAPDYKPKEPERKTTEDTSSPFSELPSLVIKV